MRRRKIPAADMNRSRRAFVLALHFPYAQIALRLARTMALALIANVVLAGSPQQAHKGQSDLTELSLEQLANLEVTSLSKKPEKQSQIAVAVHVITQEDIRRSGATSIPDALRVAPGVHVAHVDSNKWAIGVRGFTSRLSRSLLALMDGRSVYTPLFAGVYWEVQDTLMEDIDRIEIIRGPGGAIWGANAVNGVINIITKPAKNTQGFLASAGAGSHEQGFASFRYGGTNGRNWNYRIYGKVFNRAADLHQSTGNFDGWQMGQTGFRADWDSHKRDTWTVQGDLYVGRTGQRTLITSFSAPFTQIKEGDADLSGGNVIGRWRRVLSPTQEFKTQIYYDRTNRRELSFQEKRDSFDLDFQHQVSFRRREAIVWGLGYRVTSGDFVGVPTLVFNPRRRTDNLFTAFFQHETVFADDRLRLTLGSKLEHNNYSGFEIQPSGRLSWVLPHRQSVWASISRAVRTPSRVEHDLFVTSLLSPLGPTFARFVGNKGFQSEKVVASGLGYLGQPTGRLLLNLSLFYNSYDGLLSIEPGTPFPEAVPPPPHVIVPFNFGNNIGGQTYGVELAPRVELSERWQLVGAYSYLRIDLRKQPNSLDPSTVRSAEGSSPRHQFSLQSLAQLRQNLELDLTLRYVDRLPSQVVPRYSTLDARLAWQIRSALEVSVIGRDLLQGHHAEFSGGTSGFTLVRRSIYAKAARRW